MEAAEAPPRCTIGHSPAYMTPRAALRHSGNALLGLVPARVARLLLKGFSDRPELAEAAGFTVVPTLFYSPVVQVHEVDRARLLEPRPLPGVDLRLASGLALVGELATAFGPELAAIPRHRTGDQRAWFENGTYADFDAATLYAMLRRLKPRRYVEVGCGFSTRFSTLALERNAMEGAACEAHFIEPYPSPNLLEQTLPGPLLRQSIQSVSPKLFASLQAGDVLFIDTSHVLRTQNDVEFELLRVLPGLAPGVWIHIHDIFTPYDYPEEWIFGAPRAGNNEQYAVECLLSGGGRFQVELPLFSLWKERRIALDPLCPGAKDRPAAFWLTRQAG